MTTRIDSMLPQRYRIRHEVAETADTFTLYLEPADAPGQFSFEAGQFNMLYLFGVGEVPISISGDPGVTSVLVHTVRSVGTVTAAMRALRVGDVIGVRGPYGTAWPVQAAVGKDIVLVAGGIGLAPLRPVLYHLLAQREQYGRIVLLYGARSPEELLYREELGQWRARLDLEIEVTVDRATRAWRGDVGVVTALIPRARFDPTTTVALCCGPEIMMRFALQTLEGCGVPPGQLYLSMERNMKCGIGLCGHCQYGPAFVCRHGPVFRYAEMGWLLGTREV